jgi:hypothetical protein
MRDANAVLVVGILTSMDANAQLTKLQAERSAAAARVSEVEREWRAAIEAASVSSARLSEVERTGGNATSRRAAEEQLAEAKRRAAEPWAERVEGAKAAGRDADRRYQTHVGAHLGELVETLEADGRIAAERVNAAAADLIAAHAEWQAVAGQISALITQVARPSTGDVSRSRPEADEAVRGAIALAHVGGERGVVLDRSRPPWNHLLGGHEAVEVIDGGVAAVTV